jgi:hypothetical protein
MGGACSMNGEKRNACKLLLGNPEGKRPTGGLSRRWVDNINVILRDRMVRIGLVWFSIGTSSELL